MAIKKFIPGPKKIIDHRGNPHGFYEAVCDVCGTIYYPKRSNSKYCNSKCAVVAHRTAIANGTKTKKTQEPLSKEQLIIRAKMKLKEAETKYESYLSTCGGNPGKETEELKEIQRLEKIIAEAKNHYNSLLKTK